MSHSLRTYSAPGTVLPTGGDDGEPERKFRAERGAVGRGEEKEERLRGLGGQKESSGRRRQRMGGRHVGSGFQVGPGTLVGKESVSPSTEN